MAMELQETFSLMHFETYTHHSLLEILTEPEATQARMFGSTSFER